MRPAIVWKRGIVCVRLHIDRRRRREAVSRVVRDKGLVTNRRELSKPVFVALSFLEILEIYVLKGTSMRNIAFDIIHARDTGNFSDASSRSFGRFATRPMG